MRHLLRDVNPPEQSTTQQTKSQCYNHLTNTGKTRSYLLQPLSLDSIRPSLGPSFGPFSPVLCFEKTILPSCASQISKKKKEIAQLRSFPTDPHTSNNKNSSMTCSVFLTPLWMWVAQTKTSRTLRLHLSVQAEGCVHCANSRVVGGHRAMSAC